MTRITENTIEEFTIELLERLGYQYIFNLSACNAQAENGEL
jgi:hypothetical protein